VNHASERGGTKGKWAGSALLGFQWRYVQPGEPIDALGTSCIKPGLGIALSDGYLFVTGISVGVAECRQISVNPGRAVIVITLVQGRYHVWGVRPAGDTTPGRQCTPASQPDSSACHVWGVMNQALSAITWYITW
jgi:hypothetical protein